MTSIGVIEVHKEPAVFHTFAFANDSIRWFEIPLPLVSNEEVRVPQIKNNPAVFSHTYPQSSKEITIRRRVEISKTLRHYDGKIVFGASRLIVPDICVDVAWAAGQLACLPDRRGITFHTGHRITAASQRPGVPSHSAAKIENFVERRQWCATTDKICLLARPRFGYPGVKEVEPLLRIEIRVSHWNTG